jgi:hypothetical protein
MPSDGGAVLSAAGLVAVLMSGLTDACRRIASWLFLQVYGSVKLCKFAMTVQTVIRPSN